MSFVHGFDGSSARSETMARGGKRDLTEGPFVWAGGIEDTFVPQARKGQRPLDEYELMGHYQHWREDLALAPEAGLTALRWGIPWYRVETAPGEFDWRWVDQVVTHAVDHLNLTLIADLVHYGCPLWLRGGFANPAYPSAVASFAAAFAERYRGMVRWFTPLNEPLITAEMCGKRGLWPPYLRGFRGYARLMMQLVDGIAGTIDAIRQIDPDAVIVHVEAAGVSHASHPDLEPLRAHDELVRYLATDLLTGRVDPDHPLFSWLLRLGVSHHDLARRQQRAVAPDLLGLNFYPQWSSHQLYLDKSGRVRSRLVDREGSGFAGMLEAYYRRFAIPLMVTETSAHGSDEERAGWLRASLGAVRALRLAGIPVVGYTWFPLFTMIDWRYRYGRRALGDYRLELGLYRLGDEGRRWHSTPLVDSFRACTGNAEREVGVLGSTPEDARAAG
ncbi:MAG TPA: family 1 glycosylhydrolase [Chloroflexota bacterium]|nr:family 1 glycosylhydrolase [Chloroflexota bacterium]